jgi:hypothetical protein
MDSNAARSKVIEELKGFDISITTNGWVSVNN